jgi:hypothetical protein
MSVEVWNSTSMRKYAVGTLSTLYEHKKGGWVRSIPC